MTATVVCVLGMHRSGTTAFARVLSSLGVAFGPPERQWERWILKFPSATRADNPEGFWEHAGVVGVNDAILERFGGSWHEPPSFPVGWESWSELSDLRARAATLIHEDFSGAPVWGWKDPRACLTLPFWRTMLSSMRYVLCLRSPLSVARSLQARDGFPFDKSGRLWLAYVASALIHTAGQPRLLVSYEDLMTAGEAEVRRIARFVGLSEEAASGEAWPAIQAAIRPDLQHHQALLPATLAEHGLPFPALALYAELHLSARLRQSGGDEADEAGEAVTALARAAVKGHAEPQEVDADAGSLLARYQHLLVGLRGDHGRLVADHGRLVADHGQLIAERDRLQAAVESLQAGLERYREALAGLEAHPVWRGYLRLRSTLLPAGSRREALFGRAHRSLGWRRSRSG